MDERDYAAADELQALIAKRLGISSSDLQCPREQSEMTPCIARDGRLAVVDASHRASCAGCEYSVQKLLLAEKQK